MGHLTLKRKASQASNTCGYWYCIWSHLGASRGGQVNSPNLLKPEQLSNIHHCSFPLISADTEQPKFPDMPVWGKFLVSLWSQGRHPFSTHIMPLYFQKSWQPCLWSTALGIGPPPQILKVLEHATICQTSIFFNNDCIVEMLQLNVKLSYRSHKLNKQNQWQSAQRTTNSVVKLQTIT